MSKNDREDIDAIIGNVIVWISFTILIVLALGFVLYPIFTK